MTKLNKTLHSSFYIVGKEKKVAKTETERRQEKWKESKEI